MVQQPIFNNLADSPPSTQKYCGLLVRVRSPEEARLSLSHAIDVLDLKEPLAGALGAVPDTVIEIVQQLVERLNPEHRPKLSFALGELADWDFERWPSLLDRFQMHQVRGFDYVKIGLAEAQQLKDWRGAWNKLFAGLPEGTQPVVLEAFCQRIVKINFDVV